MAEIIETPNAAIERDGEAELRKIQKTQDVALQYQEDAIDSYDGTKIKFVPTPNFTECNSTGSMLPVNMVSETILNLAALSKELNEKGSSISNFVKEKLHYNSILQLCMAYNSEQIEAIAMIIIQLEKGKGFILGDQAGLGKGRVLAGINRYCYYHDIVPCFFTFSANLFSAMWSDLVDIGGFGTDTKGKMIMPEPFIMNDSKTDPDAIIIDELGNELYAPEDKEEIYKICKRGKMPKKFNCVFTTYSQVSSTRKREGDDDNVKHSFLKKIAPNAIFEFDESHIASGLDTTIGVVSREIISLSKGVVFSSATYAKNPQAFSLYILKTALSEAQIDIDKIEKAISIGGENVAEYIASALVKEGQMIRRERSYDGCNDGKGTITVYKNGDDSLDEARIAVYRKYDASMRDFRELHGYLRSGAFKGGITAAVLAEAERWEYDLVPTEFWGRSASTINGVEKRENFLNDNLGKWIPKIDWDTLGSTVKFHFKENLILAVKAKLTVDTILKELGTQIEYPYLDGKKYLTNRKPVIAIRSTLEAVFDKINLQEGETIANDFSEYTKAIVKDCRRGRVVFYKVTEDFFEKGRKISATRRAQIEKVKEYTVRDEYLADGGQQLSIIQEKIESFTAGIPLSVIDYLREEIQSKSREEWDSINPNNKADRNPNPNYVFLEVTGRKKMLQHIGEDRWIITKNTKEEQIKQSFNLFNNGMGDVLLINSSGSTGESAHSSEKFKDQRPRIMCNLQIQLNINTEVQIRGRVHRTGQVNLPAYMYIVSLIPSEIRMLLAMRKKMKKLDANVSANQVQSDEITDIRDANGDPIYDFFNKYGAIAFETDYINLTENEYYANIWNSIGERQDTVEKIVEFCRLLELELSSIQEQFYNEINQKYIDEVRKQISLQTYQLELETINYKAALHARVLRALGYGNSEFSTPLFIEDKFTLETRKTLPKEKVTAKVAELCKGLRPEEFHAQLMQECDAEYSAHIVRLLAKFNEKAPNRSDYENDEAYALALTKHREFVEAKRQELAVKKGVLESTLNYFTPNKKVLIPNNFMELQGKDAVKEVEGGDETKAKAVKGKAKTEDVSIAMMLAKEKNEAKKEEVISPIPAIFMGYKIKKSTTTLNKFSESNIELHFALLNGTPPVLVLKPSRDAVVLSEIQNQSLQLSGYYGKAYHRDLDEWRFDPNKRYLKRFLSGNILSGIVEANRMRNMEKGEKKENRQLQSWNLVRYTNYDGSVSTGISMNYGSDDVIRMAGELTRPVYDNKGTETQASRFRLNVPAPHDNVIRYIKLVPATFEVINDKSLNWGSYIDLMGGWLRIVRPLRFKDTFELHLYNGSEDKGTRSIKDPKSILYNKYFYDADFLSIIKPNHVGTPTNRWGLNNNEAGEKLRSVFVLQYRFNFDNPEDLRVFKEAMTYMWQQDKTVLTFKAITDDYYTVLGKEDIYNEGDEKSKSEKIFSFGEYEYAFESTPNDAWRIPNEIRKLPAGSKTGRYGGVVLSYPLEPHLLLPFAMYPISLSYSDTVKVWLSMFDGQEKIRILAELKALMDKNATVREIGNWVEKETATKVAAMKYVFGDLDIIQVGEVLKTYYESGDLSQLNFQVEKQTEIALPKKKTKVDYASAEKFLIYMLS